VTRTTSNILVVTSERLFITLSSQTTLLIEKSSLVAILVKRLPEAKPVPVSRFRCETGSGLGCRSGGPWAEARPWAAAGPTPVGAPQNMQLLSTRLKTKGARGTDADD